MSLLDDARRAVRVSDETFDDEIRGHVRAALYDMRRAGVREHLLDPSRLSPLAHEAVMLWTKANFGYDNPESERFMSSYRQTLCDLLNSSANECDVEDGAYDRMQAYADGLLSEI